MYGATLLKSTLKLGLAGGAVFLTFREGVWSTSSQGSMALDKVQTSVLPTTAAYLHKMPSTDDISSRATSSWNRGVKTVFSGLYAAPETIGHYGKETVNYLTEKKI